MWGGAPPPGMYAAAAPAVQGQQQSSNTNNQQKHDIFVGNLAFHTTEEQLHQAFSEIGRVIKVRLVTDAETGKPRGFAFVEFEDPQAALSAIRNMNDFELNGRRLRVNFSNSSHLEALAGKLGMDLSQQTQQRSNHQSNNNSTNNNTTNNDSGNNNSSSNSNNGQQAAAAAGTQLVADALKGMSKSEMYDVIAKLKEISDRDPDEARRIIAGHPQLPEAILFFMSKLDMVKDNPAAAVNLTAVTMPAIGISMVAPPAAVDPRARAVDPRARVDPRAAAAAVPLPAAAMTAAMTAPPPPAAPPRADPRARLDPRARAAPPPPMLPPPPAAGPYAIPPPPTTQPPQPGVANLDPALIQQVMSLTPHQISQLPPDKQQSILALRQQITGGR